MRMCYGIQSLIAICLIACCLTSAFGVSTAFAGSTVETSLIENEGESYMPLGLSGVVKKSDGKGCEQCLVMLVEGLGESAKILEQTYTQSSGRVSGEFKFDSISKLDKTSFRYALRDGLSVVAIVDGKQQVIPLVRSSNRPAEIRSERNERGYLLKYLHLLEPLVPSQATTFQVVNVSTPFNIQEMWVKLPSDERMRIKYTSGWSLAETKPVAFVKSPGVTEFTWAFNTRNGETRRFETLKVDLTPQTDLLPVPIDSYKTCLLSLYPQIKTVEMDVIGDSVLIKAEDLHLLHDGRHYKYRQRWMSGPSIGRDGKILSPATEPAYIFPPNSTTALYSRPSSFDLPLLRYAEDRGSHHEWRFIDAVSAERRDALKLKQATAKMIRDYWAVSRNADPTAKAGIESACGPLAMDSDLEDLAEKYYLQSRETTVVPSRICFDSSRCY